MLTGANAATPRTGSGDVPSAAATRDSENRTHAYSDVVQEEATQIWQATLRSLNEGGLPAPQRAFLAQASLMGMLGDTALIAVPDEFTKDIVESRARESLVEALSAQTGKDVRLAVTVDPTLRGPLGDSEQPVLDGYPAGSTASSDDAPIPAPASTPAP